MQFLSGRYEIVDSSGAAPGVELFLLTTTPDGWCTLQSATHMPGPDVSRHVHYELDAAGAAQRASIRVRQGPEPVQRAEFTFLPGGLRGELAEGVSEPRIQQLELTGCAPAFGTHALLNDAWFVRLHDLEGPDEQQHRCAVSSVSEHGDTGLAAEVIGLQTRSLRRGANARTPAGFFRVDWWSLAFGGMPALELAVRQADQLLVELRWAHTRTHVQLTALAEGRVS